MARLTFDPATYDSATKDFTPGLIYTAVGSEGKQFLYAKLDGGTGTISVSNGDVVTYSNTSTTETSVSADAGDTTWSGYPAGVAVGVVTAGNYGFFQTRGIHSAVSEGGTVTSRTEVIPDQTTDGGADDVVVGSEAHLVFGVALAAAAGGTFPCQIRLS